ncbi:sugar transferase, partial [bacterium]|nr:sugar transferase [bacterium]
HFNKFGHLLPQGTYSILLILFLAYWYTLSTYYNKYSPALGANYLTYVKAILSSSVLTLFLITSTVSLTDLIAVSRLFLIQITLIPMIVEILIVTIFRKTLSSKYIVDEYKEPDTKISTNSNYKFIWVIFGATMLFIIYFLMIKMKTGTFYLYPWSERILLVLFASWLASILLTKKYSFIKTNNISYILGPYIKSGLVMLLISAMVYFFFRIESLSRFLLFGTIIIYTLLETLSFLIYYISKKYDSKSNIDGLLAKTNFSWNIENYDFDAESAKYHSDKEISIRSIFNQISSLNDKDQIIDFLEKNLNNITINFYSSSILSTISLENIEIIRNNSKNLLVNLHKLNDIRYLNQYLITSHMKLIPNGILVGYLLPIETTFNRLQNQMPKFLFTLFYPFHFLFSRVLPKLPKINRLYFLITRGNNRTISKAEMYGRLNFCGFKIEKDIIINDKLFFIAKKVKTVSKIANPSYHPIVKLTRVGYNKELIKIHKFRTMHPYSEFLQKDIYEDNELDTRGKFKNDFRITSWGKIMRKFWIDELPQIYDWVQGRLNLVGVRALSEQYFSLYTKELQDLRTKFKPGIIPPYYVDLPENLDDIFKSEERYLLQKAKSPLKTDLKYGLKALINIIFKGARSS